MTGAFICECNPFHKGHLRLIDAMKRECDTVIAILSECFVQRGEPALTSAEQRTEVLLKAGVNLVVALPFPWSCGSADTFARIGVEIAEKLGADTLWFGSECGDLTLLSHIAKKDSTPLFQAHKGEATAEVFYKNLKETYGKTFGANDCLGLAYLSHIKNITPKTIHREGKESATALRKNFFEQGKEAMINGLPEIAKAPYKACGNWYSIERLGDSLHLFFQLKKGDFDDNPFLSGGLGSFLVKTSLESKNFREWMEKSNNKTYTYSRIRRGILWEIAGATKKDDKMPLEYISILGADKKGVDYLHLHKNTDIPIVTNKRGKPNGRQTELEEIGYSLFAHSGEGPERVCDFIKRNARIVEEQHE